MDEQTSMGGWQTNERMISIYFDRETNSGRHSLPCVFLNIHVCQRSKIRYMIGDILVPQWFLSEINKHSQSFTRGLQVIEQLGRMLRQERGCHLQLQNNIIITNNICPICSFKRLSLIHHLYLLLRLIRDIAQLQLTTQSLMIDQFTESLAEDILDLHGGTEDGETLVLIKRRLLVRMQRR